MIITCPKCQFARNIPDEQIPPRSKVATCPSCEHRFQFREIAEDTDTSTLDDLTSTDDNNNANDSSNFEAKREVTQAQAQDAAAAYLAARQKKTKTQDEPPQGPETSEPLQVEVPFEDLEHFGFFAGMYQTIRRTCLSPKLFFSVMPLRGLIRPMVFGLMVTEFVLIMSAFWQLSGVPDLTTIFMEQQGMAPLSPQETLNPMLLFVMVPLLYLFELFLSTAVIHGVLSILKSGKRGFEGTFRVMAYCQAPVILSALPFGTILAVPWSLAVTFIGLKYMHSTDYPHVALAFAALVAVFGVVFFLPMLTMPSP